MDDKVKAALEEMKGLFVEFKAANDERIAMLEERDLADPLLTERVDKLNLEISNLQEKIEKAQKQAEEASVQAQRIAGGGGEVTDKDARQFYAMITNTPPEDVVPDVEGYTAYRRAFTSYLRRGEKQIQDLLQVGADPDGGYFVTPDVTGRIATLVQESSPIRSIASVAVIGTDALEGINDLDEETGGGWVAELASRDTETTTSQVGLWRIPVHEQYMMPAITQKMLDDANIQIEAWLEGKIASRIVRVENTAFILGTGVGQPRGFLDYAHGIPSSTTWDVIQRTPSGAAGAFAATDPGDALVDMIYTLKDAYMQGAIFVMRRTTEAEVRKLKDGNGNYLWQPDFQNLKATQLLGFPIVRAEDMPVIAANSLSIAFGNFAEGYQIVDRVGLRVLRDPFTTKGRVKFYTTKRVGGDVVNFEAIKLLRFATTA